MAENGENMQKQKIVSLIEEGEKVLDANRVLPSVEPTIVPLAAFETWMGKITRLTNGI